MEDVARLAGVSMVTVSRAVNTPDKLAPQTLAQVRKAIKKLHYVHNQTAGSLASNRSRIIAAIVPTIASSIFSDTVDGLAQTLSQHQYQLFLGQSHYDLQEEARLIDTFLGRRVDGLVLTGVDHARGVRSKLQRAGLPVVETWDLTPRPIDMVVGFSNFSAGCAAAEYLIGKGFRCLAFVGGTDHRSLARLKGFKEAIKQARLSGPVVVHTTSPSTLLDGSKALGELLSGGRVCDAVFCSNDMLAAGVLFECQRKGIKVPLELAVMGFADLPIAAGIQPALTTVQVHSTVMGQWAGANLMARLYRLEKPSIAHDLGFSVVARDSA
jgi:LacI family transcriptional regulator, gluconate utilization system Gnt-I transcriptional repressor